MAMFIMAMFIATPAIADKRVALVIGNSAYRNVAPLDNPGNDARLLADTLRGLGFTLVGGDAQLDMDKASFDRAVQDFGAQLQGADVGLFFYAGHGVQVNGTNYLIPVDANLENAESENIDFEDFIAKKLLETVRMREPCRSRCVGRHIAKGPISGVISAPSCFRYCIPFCSVLLNEEIRFASHGRQSCTLKSNLELWRNNESTPVLRQQNASRTANPALSVVHFTT